MIPTAAQIGHDQIGIAGHDLGITGHTLLGMGGHDGSEYAKVGQHLFTPATDGADEILPNLLLPLRDVVNPGGESLFGTTPIGTVPDMVEALLVLVSRQELGGMLLSRSP